VLLAALRELFPRGATPGHHGRHVLIEYVMLKGVNDTLEDAQRLLQLTLDIEAKFNLIVFNPFPETLFRCSDPEQASHFHPPALPHPWNPVLLGQVLSRQAPLKRIPRFRS
jgi:23S rRNA (adenine2503-C2)-methyltransferase